MDIFNKLKLNPSNPRTIKEVAFNKLKKSIKEFPEMLSKRPIVYDENNIILGGNMRFRALQDLVKEGFEVKDEYFMSTDGWDETKKRTFVIKDNIEMGEWDDDVLANEWSDLPLEEWGIDTSGWSKEVEEDEAPEVAQEEPKSKRGEIYQLGKHRLLCGDSTKIEDVEKLMNGQKADMVFTDPSYNTGMGSKNAGSTWLNHMFEDNYTDEEWVEFMGLFITNYSVIMKDNSVAYICLDWRRNYELIPHLKKYFHLSNIIVWDKMVHGLGSDYKYTYELINVCKKGSPDLQTHQGDDREYSDVWHIQRKMGKDEEHATKKPLELCTRAIRHASKDNEIVADLFGGSGSTLIACEQLNRTCYMMELDEKYVDVIRKRYAKFIGKETEWETITKAL